jgi:site-specific DNA recombinase
MQSDLKVALYCRVSTNSQDTASQESELKRFAQLRGWTIFKIYRDRGYSGANINRPAFQELLSDVRRHRFDIVLFFRLDRIARSLRELINVVELCRQHKIGFVSSSEGIDTSSDSASGSGELIFQIFGAVAQFERSLIGSRVRAGLQHAREQGKRIGRPVQKVLSEGEQKEVLEEREQKGTSLRALAKKHRTTVWQVSRALVSNGRV